MEKIKKFKKILKNKKIDGYIIPKNDEFFGEYTPNYKDRLKYISNFSGSYGIALILKNHNFLFVDGRYILQANRESGNYFKIKNIIKKLPKNILKNKKLKIGYDPRIFSSKLLNYFFFNKKIKLIPINENLIDQIWVRKTKFAIKRFYLLSNSSFVQNYKTKVRQAVDNLKKIGADFLFITASENNAWLLNIRGGDSDFSPIPNSYILLHKSGKINFFCNTKKVSDSLKEKLKIIKFNDINLTEKILSKINNIKFVIDRNTCSIFFENIIQKNNFIMKSDDPVHKLKAIKSKKEIQNIQKAHIFDGVALTKYIFWLKKNFLKKRITEISGEQKLLTLRKQHKCFKSLSFPTISGSGPNGAIIHYRATKKTNRRLKKGDIYLVDSGGQYFYGTTDVTRTVSLNNSNERIKNIFTRVLKGHIAVANTKLKRNITGSMLDRRARKYLKQINLDYSHGTGHGVGYFLNVHEGPHSISKNNLSFFKEGMIVSNEPGYYEKNYFGIRIENLIYVKKKKLENFFENLTLVPIDKELIDKSILNINEINWINKYHKRVFNNLKKYMNKVEFLELQKSCSAI